MGMKSVRCLAALLVALGPLTALAEESPYYIGLQQTFGFDSNVFRLPDRTQIGSVVVEPESSGLISTTLLMAGIDQPIGRQRVYGDLSAGYVSYGSQSELDSPTYSLVAGIDWDTAEKVSGNLQLNSGRRLGAYGDRDIPTGRGDNDERYNRVALLARLGDHLRSRAWLQADVVWDQLRNDVTYLLPVPVTGISPLRFSDGYSRDETAASFGLSMRYRWQGATIVGVGLRTESRTLDVERRLTDPTETAASATESRRNDLDFFLGHQVGDLHDLSLRLSYGITEYVSPAAADLNDWTGSLRWVWRPTGKLLSNLRLLYDSEDRDAGASSPADAGGARQSSGIEWRLDYAATAKVSAHLSASFFRRDYGLDAASFTDHDSTFSLGARWAALRHTTLGCSVGTDRRSSTQEAVLSRSSYDAALFSCFAEVLVR